MLILLLLFRLSDYYFTTATWVFGAVVDILYVAYRYYKYKKMMKICMAVDSQFSHLHQILADKLVIAVPKEVIVPLTPIIDKKENN